MEGNGRDEIEVENGYDLEEDHGHKKDRKEEQQEELSGEGIFENQGVPSWRNQLTLRAFVVSFVLSILFTVIVMKLNLTTGIVPSLNISAGLLGFFFIKTWTKFLEKSGKRTLLSRLAWLPPLALPVVVYFLNFLLPLIFISSLNYF